MVWRHLFVVLLFSVSVQLSCRPQSRYFLDFTVTYSLAVLFRGYMVENESKF